MLLDHVEDLDRAHEYATKVDESEVWSELAHAELERGAIANAIGSYLRANDASRRVPNPGKSLCTLSLVDCKPWALLQSHALYMHAIHSLPDPA